MVQSGFQNKKTPERCVWHKGEYPHPRPAGSGKRKKKGVKPGQGEMRINGGKIEPQHQEEEINARPGEANAKQTPLSDDKIGEEERGGWLTRSAAAKNTARDLPNPHSTCGTGGTESHILKSYPVVTSQDRLKKRPTL